MKNNLNIQKMAEVLSPKERAKMMVLSFDEEFKSGRSSLSREEKDKLRNFTDSREREIYRFYFDLRSEFAPIIHSGIESASLRISIGYLLLCMELSKSEDIFPLENIASIIEAIRDKYQLIHSYKAVWDQLIEKYDFPVVGEVHKVSTEENIQISEDTVSKINLILSAIQKITKKSTKKLLIEMPIIDSELVAGFLDAIDTYAKECGI